MARALCRVPLAVQKLGCVAGMEIEPGRPQWLHGLPSGGDRHGLSGHEVSLEHIPTGECTVSSRKEKPIKEVTREEKIQNRMLERIRASRTLESKFEATLDPRQFQPKEQDDGRG